MGKCLDICPRKEDLMQNHNRVIHIFQKHLQDRFIAQNISKVQLKIINNCESFATKKTKLVNFQNFDIMLGKIGNLFGSKQELGSTDYTLS